MPKRISGSAARRRPTTGITVADLAQDKKLPESFLRSLGLRDRDDGVLVFYLPYDGGPAPRQRLRTALRAKDGSFWLAGEGSPVPYGLDRLSEARKHDFVVLVEGESDCWTLWFHGFPALGIPGADMAGKLDSLHVEGISRFYIIREPGQSGETFVPGVLRRLSNLGWKGEVGQVLLDGANELHQQDPDAFKEAFRRVLDAAEPLTLPKRSAVEDPIEIFLIESGIAQLGPNASLVTVDLALRKLVQRLASEDELTVMVVREAAIKKLAESLVKAPAKLFDAAVSGTAARDADVGQGQFVLFPTVEPWPDAVDGAAFLEEIAAAFTKYVMLPPGAADTQALWVVHAHALDASFISPFIALDSPQRRCGKTTNLEVFGGLVPRPLLASNITAAALFRSIETYTPTLLVDEADTFLRNNGELRGILNSGHTRATAKVMRTVGDAHEPRLFSTWCAKAIAMIGKLAPTLEDRSIVIHMRRKKRGEKVERLRRDRIQRELEPLHRRAARWAADHLPALREADPEVPDELHDRDQDNWRPLLAIADHAGGDWPERGRRAARLISGCSDENEETAAVQLLADLRQMFDQRGSDRLSSEEIVQALVEMEDRPWPEWRNGRPLSKRQLANLLRPFGARPRVVREGRTTFRGYLVKDLLDPFERYVPKVGTDDAKSTPFNQEPSFRSVTTVTSAESQPNPAPSDPKQGTMRYGSENDEKGFHSSDVTDVTDRDREDLGRRRPCRSCRGTKWWRSTDGPVVCATCHPPGSPDLVAEWIEDDNGDA